MRAVARLERWRAGAGALRSGLHRVPLLVDARPGEVLTLPTVAALAGDWPTAVRAGRARLARDPSDGGARAACAIGLWELGEEAAADALFAGADADEAVARAAVRYGLHRDQPMAARAALARLDAPPRRLELGVAELLHRHGDGVAADALAARVLRRAPGDRDAARLRRRCAAEARVLAGTWARPVAPVALDPVPGRILHLLKWSLPHRRSGSTYRSHYLVGAQRAAGLDPHVLTQPGSAPGGGGRAVWTEAHDGVCHHRLADSAAAPVDAWLDGYLQAAATVVERVRPAILHAASDYTNGLVALELGRRYSLPVVYEVRSFPELMPARLGGSRAAYEKSAWRREVEARCWRSAQHVVTLSEGMRDHIVAHGVDPSGVTVVPNAVDADRFQPVDVDPARRAGAGAAPGELVVGYVSTLVPYEGLATLVEAVARLRSQGRAVRALIVGDGPEREPLRQLASRLGVADRVRLPGRVGHDEVPALYAQLDVFVVPRRDEAVCRLVTPLKPYEAMAAGRAVVVSGTPALLEMIVEGETGVSFVPDDVGSLCAVLAGLADDPARREALGRRARRWVAEHRGWDRNAAILAGVYGRLA